MKVLCAWCCREGLPGYMGEREPLDDPQPTQGICALHQESQPSQSYPDAKMLIVVRRTNPVLDERLSGSFAAMSGVELKVPPTPAPELASEGTGLLQALAPVITRASSPQW